MNRRDALKTSSILLGYTVSVGTVAAVMSGCQADPAIDWSPNNLNPGQALLVAEMAEMIIPKTETPGAKDALVDRFIDAILDCYPDSEKQDFLDKLDAFDARVREDHGCRFYNCPEDKRRQIMDQLVAESGSGDGPSLFDRMKEWTVTGYCRSEAGSVEHLAWNPVPGPYRGCIDFDEVGKTWAL